jgi:hypothetical protein
MYIGDIAIYGIASPANSNQGDWIARDVYPDVTNITSYTTSAHDFVIGGLNVLYPLLPSNINIPYSITDPLGHNLISIYLSDPDSLEQISAMIDLEAFWLIYNAGVSIPYVPSPTYYKLAVVQKLKVTSGGLIGPDGSFLCNSGYCNRDFNYYILQDHPKQTGIKYYEKIFLLPTIKFKPGTYVAAATSEPQGYQLVVFFAEGEHETRTTQFNSSTNTCYPSRPSTVDPYMFADLETPWYLLQQYCAQYFEYGMFISSEAEIY